MSNKNGLLRAFKLLILAFPFFMFPSYYPRIAFGQNETMNLEISLTIIWLVVFGFVGAALIATKKKLGNILKIWPWLILPLFFAISLLWSHDKMRGVLIIGVLGFIYLGAVSLYCFKDDLLNKQFKKRFLMNIFIASLIACSFCLVQCILDNIGLPTKYTAMCAGCNYITFGFPHPSGLAIEPQFMGNLLLAPIIICVYCLFKKLYFKRRFLIVTLAVLVATLFLTLSRGAIYAFGASMILLTIYQMIKSKSGKVLSIWVLILISFLFTLNLQGLFAEFSKTDDTYISGASKVINQLSLGVVDLGGSNVKKEAPKSSSQEAVPPKENESSRYDGYVEASTDERIWTWRTPFEILGSDARVALFGVGFGDAPLALYEYGKTSSSRNIIQNEYINMLLEVGIIGFCLIIFNIYLLLKLIKGYEDRMLFYAILLAYAFTLCFFSGLPNALHIYMLPAILLALFSKKSARKA